jgi:hypothetical protein
MSSEHDSGDVSVNRSLDHPDAKNFPYPTHQLVGIVNSEELAWRVVSRLRDEGLSDGVELFLGQAGVERLHSVHAATGLAAHLRQITGGLGPEMEHSQEYEEAIAAGGVLVAIKATDEAAQEIARNALTDNGGHSLRYYSRLTIRDL